MDFVPPWAKKGQRRKPINNLVLVTIDIFLIDYLNGKLSVLFDKAVRKGEKWNESSAHKVSHLMLQKPLWKTFILEKSLANDSYFVGKNFFQTSENSFSIMYACVQERNMKASS